MRQGLTFRVPGDRRDQGLAASPLRQQRVFVPDKHGPPLMGRHPGRARKLLASGRGPLFHLHAPAIEWMFDMGRSEELAAPERNYLAEG